MSTVTDVMQGVGGVASVIVAVFALRTATEANRIAAASQARDDAAEAAARAREESAQAAAEQRELDAERRADEREAQLQQRRSEEARVQPLARAYAFARRAIEAYHPYMAAGGLTANYGQEGPFPDEVAQWVDRAPGFEAEAKSPEVAQAIANLRRTVHRIELQPDWSNASLRGLVRQMVEGSEAAFREAAEIIESAGVAVPR